MVTEIWVNIHSGNGLLPDSTKQLPWTNVDWSLMKSCDIRIKAISQDIAQPSIIKICLKNYIYKVSNFSRANELKMKSPIQINAIDHLNNPQTHSSKAILDDIKGNCGAHSLNVTSQWLLYVTTSNN